MKYKGGFSLWFVYFFFSFWFICLCVDFLGFKFKFYLYIIVFWLVFRFRIMIYEEWFRWKFFRRLRCGFGVVWRGNLGVLSLKGWMIWKGAYSRWVDMFFVLYRFFILERGIVEWVSVGFLEYWVSGRDFDFCV